RGERIRHGRHPVAPGVPPDRPASRRSGAQDLRGSGHCWKPSCNGVAAGNLPAAAMGGLPAPEALAREAERRGPRSARRLTMVRFLSLCVLCAIPSIAAAAPAPSQTVPLDASRWELEGNAKFLEHQGRPSVLLDGGAAT